MLYIKCDPVLLGNIPDQDKNETVFIQNVGKSKSKLTYVRFHDGLLCTSGKMGIFKIEAETTNEIIDMINEAFPDRRDNLVSVMDTMIVNKIDDDIKVPLIQVIGDCRCENCGEFGFKENMNECDNGDFYCNESECVREMHDENKALREQPEVSQHI